MNKTKANSKGDSAKEIMESVDSAIEKRFSCFDSEQYQNYLKTMAKFHNYSLNNTLLIAMRIAETEKNNQTEAKIVCRKNEKRLYSMLFARCTVFLQKMNKG